MSQNSAGDITAIRDWANRFFYTKEEVADLLIKSTISGLKAYILTFAAPQNTDITIEERTQTDPQNYSFNMGPSTIYKSIFFFHQNATILVNGNSITLDSYTKTISVNSNGYLPASILSNIIFTAPKDSNIWENVGSTPLELSSAIAIDSTEDARYVKAKTSGNIAKVDLNTVQSEFTAYIVAKLNISGANQYARLLSSSAARSAGNSIMLSRMNSGSTVNVSSWGDSDTDTGVPLTDYFAAAIRYTSAGDSAGFVMGTTGNAVKKSKTSIQHGRYVVIGATDENFSDQTNLEPSDIYVKFFGAVNESETDVNIETNLTQLRDIFM